MPKNPDREPIVKISQYLDGAGREIEHRELIGKKPKGDQPVEYVGRATLMIPPPPNSPPEAQPRTKNLVFAVPAPSILVAFAKFDQAKQQALREYVQTVQEEMKKRARKPTLVLPQHIVDQMKKEPPTDA